MAAAPATIFLAVLCSVGLRTVIDFEKVIAGLSEFFARSLLTSTHMDVQNSLTTQTYVIGCRIYFAGSGTGKPISYF